MRRYTVTQYLIGVCETTHTAHDTENVVVGGINTDLSSLGSLNSRVRQDQLERGVINPTEVARAGRLVFFRAEREGVDVDTSVGVAGMVLVGLNEVEVGSFTFREAVLAVKLELGSDNGVLAPAVHVNGGLRKNECAGVRDTRVFVVTSNRNSAIGKRNIRASEVHLVVGIRGSVPVSSVTGRCVLIHRTSVVEESTSIDIRAGISGNRLGTSEGMDSIRKSINRISVVEGLGAENLEEESIASQGRAVVDVLIGLDDPNELLNGVVEVELDLVTRGTNRLITCELELGNQVFVGVLCHSATFISIQKHVVNVKGSSDKRLVVCDGGGDRASDGVLTGRSRA